MANRHAPFYPIIYVRGYAMTPDEIDETSADPFCGFNLGSTVYRAVPERDRQPRKYIFESPVIRLASEFNYEDVYEDGYDILDPEWSDDKSNKLTSRSIVIYRYYDEASRLLGIGETPSIEVFSQKLGDLILKVRDLVCANPANKIEVKDFRCYLVAHSMGGLVCRGLLHNTKNDVHNARQYVDKFFTYATPHNGIDMLGINIPSWLSKDDMNNFNRNRMAKYLGLEDAYKETNSVAWIPEEQFSSERVFTMVGTNRLDYEAAMGVSRTFAGHGSDGLVRIGNATLKGIKTDGSVGQSCAKAFTYRAHSGFFGIVNSEESYQNLTRFLFGDVRVDIWAEIEEVRLPKKVQEAVDKGGKVNALYQIEVLAAPRGKLWQLTRRRAEEDSVACIPQKELLDINNKPVKEYLSSVFLAKRERVNKRRPSLACNLDLGIRVPDYEIDRKLWIDDHFEGGYLFRNSIAIELIPPTVKKAEWRIKYCWQNLGCSQADIKIDAHSLDEEKVEVIIPFDSATTPGATGKLRFVISGWNKGASMKN
ncbi:MAG: esterase/lipase family protein [Methylophilaceae bacterium]